MVRKQTFVFLFLMLIFSFLISLCTPTPTAPEFVSAFVVNAYLTVGSKVDTVSLTRSLSLETPYSQEVAGVTADSVFLLADGVPYALVQAGRPGLYIIEGDSLVVASCTEYRLLAYIGGSVIRASTIAPEQVRITGVNADTAFFPYPDPDLTSRFRINWEAIPDVEAYEISILARPPFDLVDFGIPRFIEQALEANDYDTLATFPPVTDFPVPSSETSIELSWDAFLYYGDYTIKVYAADDNLWDLATSNAVYISQSSEFEQPSYNIEGALGIFAAVSIDSLHVHVKKQE